MKQTRLVLGVGVVLCAASLPVRAVTIGLYEYAFNVDGTVSNPSGVNGPADVIPGNVDLSGFNLATGLGQIVMTLTGAGAHYASVFLDHEIDEAMNTYFNEFGSATGAPGPGQSWEIDEPGYAGGDIYANFDLSALDNTAVAGPEDISMALGWGFNLLAGETATISMLLSETDTGGGFYLVQTDPDSAASIYFSSALDISGGPPGVPDAGSTIALLSCALLGIAGGRFAIKRADR